MTVRYLLVIGTLIWLALLLTSILFPPKGGSMRFREKALIVLSALLGAVWLWALLMSTAATA